MQHSRLNVATSRIIKYSSKCITYLEPLPDSLQQVGHHGVVPEVSEPDLRGVRVHRTGQEQTRPCGTHEHRGLTLYLTSSVFALMHFDT